MSHLEFKFKELLAQKCREGLDEECDILCAGIKYMYSMCVEYLDKQMKPVEDDSFYVGDI
jgi:hypothetical protein